MTDTPRNGIRIHTLLIGLVLVAVNSYWVMMGTEVWHSTQVTIASLFFNAIFTLLILVVLHLVFQRFIPRLSMGKADLLTVYVMVVMLTTISGHTMMGYLLPALAHAFRFASAENEWEQLFGAHVPRWIAVTDEEALQGFYQGDSTFYTTAHLQAWLSPILTWSCFVVALWLVLLGLTVFLRKQWTDNERLNYPIVQLPIAMVNDPKKLFTNRWMWLGFGLAAIAEIFSGLNFLFPSVPSLPIKGVVLGRFSSRPWRAMGPIAVSFYPFTIGLMFFTPLDLSFSCWFFYVVGRIQAIITDALGARNIYGLEQQTGAWIAFGLIPLWLGRRYYLRVIRKVLNRNYPLNDSSEPMTYRTAALVVAVGLIFLFTVLQQAGMSFWVIGLFFLVYFPMVIGVTRIRAEIGPPLHQLIFVDPGRTIVNVLGTRPFGTTNLVGLTFLYPFVRCFRAHPMPSELEALRIAERTGIGYRQLLVGMILAIGFGIIVTFWLYLHTM